MTYNVFRIISLLDDFELDKFMLLDFSNPIVKGAAYTIGEVDGFKSLDMSGVSGFTYVLPQTLNFNSRKTIELDILSSVDIPEESVVLDLVESGSLSSVKESIKNVNSVSSGTLSTLKFKLVEILGEKELSSIGAIRIQFPEPTNIKILKIAAYTNNYNVTNEEILEQINKAERYVISSIGSPEIPETLKNAVEYIAAAFIWSKSNGNQTDTKNSYYKTLLKTANNLINNYLFGRTQLNSEKGLLPMKKTGGYTNINIKKFWDDNE
jgi:hypothetical protein